MRKRFEQQLTLGQLPIEDTFINPKSKNALDQLLAALKEIYTSKEYNQKVFSVLEKHISAKKVKTGRNGMNLWTIFVLAQVRLCFNISYNVLHNQANNHRTMRQLMGVEYEFGFKKIYFEYQNIYDNVSMLSNDLIAELNQIILEFGHGEVFKKKENTVLLLKSDSFVVKSNVHFPTDYNLLWDSARKCIDTVQKILKRHYNLPGWRKIDNWRYQLKGLMRELGKASTGGGKNKQQRVESAAKNYLKKSKAFVKKLNHERTSFPLSDEQDMAFHIMLEHFLNLLKKHIDLVERRILKKEKIPHAEKLFSIFETYTEWIKKGKMHPNVELGKKLLITTDQYGLIVDYYLMNNQHDSTAVLPLADRMLSKYKIFSWSFDKGFWSKENKELLRLEIPKVVMPKKGKLNQEQKEEQNHRSFKKLKNKHSAIESNINELEGRGLDRCPDRGEGHFAKYVGLGVSAYNLKRIGKEILQQKLKAFIKKAA